MGSALGLLLVLLSLLHTALSEDVSASDDGAAAAAAAQRDADRAEQFRVLAGPFETVNQTERLPLPRSAATLRRLLAEDETNRVAWRTLGELYQARLLNLRS